MLLRDILQSRRSKGTKQRSADQQEWPQIEARDGYRKMNVKVMEVLMVLVSTYKVSENKAAACLQMVLNTLCSQNLLLPSPQVVEMEDDPDPSSTRSWAVGDLTHTLPTPQTIHKWIEDGAILSLWHVADEMKVTSEKSNTATTLGTDDTVKAQGFRRADVKTGNVTIIEQQAGKKVRSNYYLGYYPNISHSGADSAITVNTVLDMLALVSDSEPDEIKDILPIVSSTSISEPGPRPKYILYYLPVYIYLLGSYSYLHWRVRAIMLVFGQYICF